MNDSDAVDEAEAAEQVAHDEVNGVGHFAPTEGSTGWYANQAEASHGEAEQLVGEIMAFGRNLFFWEDLEGDKTYINLDNVTIVNVQADGTLIVKCGDLEAWTEDLALIERFWAEWETI